MVLWDTLSNLFHAFRVYSLRLIVLKGVATITKVNNWTNSQIMMGSCCILIAFPPMMEWMFYHMAINRRLPLKFCVL